ncbi:MAG: hypothetical protein ACYC0T_13455 [Ramlibacter sp.]
MTRIQWDDGTHGCISFWRPSAAERAAIAAGALVQLTVQGRTHAPVLIGVDGMEQAT